MAPSTILVTGAAGRVASAIRPHLRRRYALRLLDRVPIDGPGEREEVLVGDLTDPGTAHAAVRGTDGVVHLACVHGLELDFERSLDANYRAMLTLLDAVRRSGVRNLVYTSSHHVLGQHRRQGFAGDRAHVAPDGYYGLGKAFGEAACAMFALRYDVATLVIRVGNADPTVTDGRRLRLWISARDLAELITIGLTDRHLGFEIVNGVSICPDPLLDDAGARALGYVPRDRALDNLDPAFVPLEQMPADAGPEHVGGSYAARPLPAPRVTA